MRRQGIVRRCFSSFVGQVSSNLVVIGRMHPAPERPPPDPEDASAAVRLKKDAAAGGSARPLRSFARLLAGHALSAGPERTARVLVKEAGLSAAEVLPALQLALVDALGPPGRLQPDEWRGPTACLVEQLQEVLAFIFVLFTPFTTAFPGLSCNSRHCMFNADFFVHI